jgi:hypothetical protein
MSAAATGAAVPETLRQRGNAPADSRNYVVAPESDGPVNGAAPNEKKPDRDAPGRKRTYGRTPDGTGMLPFLEFLHLGKNKLRCKKSNGPIC